MIKHHRSNAYRTLSDRALVAAAGGLTAWGASNIDLKINAQTPADWNEVTSLTGSANVTIAGLCDNEAITEMTIAY